ncbi:MAG: DUF2098 domain-containing protein [Methanosarcinales archaeon]|nr:DUF2098 domain-containing protein [Methanosarcinales archaeon]
MNGDISIGSTVRYTGTGSVGEVKRLEERDHELWVRLDSTGLWYATAALEVLGEGFEGNGWARKRSLKKKEWDRKLTLEELKKVEERKKEDIRHVQEITCSISAGVFG